MKITVLGCGTSGGVPLPGCTCAVCTSPEPRNKRLRTSIWIQGDNGESIIVDSGPDFRTQVIRAGVPFVSAIIYTHTHADHVCGFPDIRSFNFIQKDPIPIYATAYSATELRSMFSYAFNPDPNYIGGGVPKVTMNIFTAGETITIGSVLIQTFSMTHGHLEVIGLRIGDFVYATDCKVIPDASKQVMTGAKNLLLNALRMGPIHPTHLTIPESQALAEELKAEQTYTIHMTHQVDYLEVSRHLPNHFRLAYDGLEIDVT